ncbi:glycosyltransferase [Hamadaea sp. NPDC050747]|uniref:glycosyltransferase family 2 protein n=1 Tax=Hamadaea sp. NPDC050747 TaxID=3155789 RepID=UPI0033E8EF1D
MPLISVLSTTHIAGATYLEDALESVAAQRLPPGWELEWVIQDDGPESELRDRLTAKYDWVRYEANGARLGIAATRNFALARVRGQLVQNLDHDDLLLPGALDLVQRFDDHRIHWAIGQADDLMPDGSRKSFPPALPFGRIPAGTVNAWADEHGGNWPIHCAGLMMRTASLRAVGGYAGTPADDDVVMFAALSEAADGWWDEQFTWLYRQHAGQTIRDPNWARWGETGRRIALQRANAVRHAGMQLTAVNLDTHHVEVAPPIKETVKVDPDDDIRC